jgi:hypothetical protein
LDRGPDCDVQVVLELIAPYPLLLSSSCGHFCANLLNLSKFRSRVKLRFRRNQEHNLHLQQAGFPAYSIDITANVFGPRRSHCAKFQTATSDKSPDAFRAHKRTRLLGHAMGLFSAGFPTGAGNASNATSSNPTNRLPTSHSGQATKATGRLHCYICNFLRVAQATLHCNSRIALFLARFATS